MNMRKTYNGNYMISFGSASKLDRQIYDIHKGANKYSIEMNLFWIKFRIHGVAHPNNPHWCTKKSYVIQYQWLGRNIHKLYDKLFSLLAPNKWKVRKHIDRWVNEIGMCTSCHDHTSVLSPCCSASVEFEGGTEYWEDILGEVCECGMEGTCYACKYYEKVA